MLNTKRVSWAAKTVANVIYDGDKIHEADLKKLEVLMAMACLRKAVEAKIITQEELHNLIGIK